MVTPVDYKLEQSLRNVDWVYSDDRKHRMHTLNGKVIIQKRVVFPENSRKRLGLKALAGKYTLMDMKVTGAGDSYLILGWETVPSMSEALDHVLAMS